MGLSFFEQYGCRKRFYPVIHVQDVEQTLINTERAVKAGADGVFLIGHNLQHQALTLIANAVRVNHPNLFLGINYLDLEAEDAFTVVETKKLQALWVDNSGIGDITNDWAIDLHQRMTTSSFSGYYFASVAFKGQSEVYDLASAARLGAKYSDVVVTSGQSTGRAPSVEKIATMKAAIPNHPLAIASGMTVENIVDFLPHADLFMVATGIGKDFYNLDSAKTLEMASSIRHFNEQHALL